LTKTIVLYWAKRFVDLWGDFCKVLNFLKDKSELNTTVTSKNPQGLYETLNPEVPPS
jgi:hypothetical protein